MMTNKMESNRIFRIVSVNYVTVRSDISDQRCRVIFDLSSSGGFTFFFLFLFRIQTRDQEGRGGGEMKRVLYPGATRRKLLE